MRNQNFVTSLSHSHTFHCQKNKISGKFLTHTCAGGGNRRCLHVTSTRECQSLSLIDVETSSNRRGTTINNFTKTLWLWLHHKGKLWAATRRRGGGTSCYVVKAGREAYEHIGASTWFRWLRLSHCGGSTKSHHQKKERAQLHFNPSWCHCGGAISIWYSAIRCMIKCQYLSADHWWVSLDLLRGGKDTRELLIATKRSVN